jgi:hypothetical protein
VCVCVRVCVRVCVCVLRMRGIIGELPGTVVKVSRCATEIIVRIICALLLMCGAFDSSVVNEFEVAS